VIKVPDASKIKEFSGYKRLALATSEVTNSDCGGSNLTVYIRF